MITLLLGTLTTPVLGADSQEPYSPALGNPRLPKTSSFCLQLKVNVFGEPDGTVCCTGRSFVTIKKDEVTEQQLTQWQVLP